MFAAVSLGVFDKLKHSRMALVALADELNSNADALERLLDACVGLKLLNYRDGLYENSPAAETYLCHDSPRALTGYINYSNRIFWKLWGNLEGAIQEGSNRWKETFGLDGSMWESFFQTEQDKREFLMGMHGYGQITSPHVVTAFDLSRFKKLVDLGGGTGHLAIAACRQYPKLGAIVFESPKAVPLAEEIVKTSAPDVANRIKVVSGDFFNDRLPEGDLYVVARTLHDWPESDVIALMKRTYEALPPDGALLVAEKLLKETKNGPDWAQMQNLNMLTCTDGKERTLREYKELLERAGFANVLSRITNSPLDVILAQRPENPKPIEDKSKQTIGGLETHGIQHKGKRPSFELLAPMYHAFFEQARVGFVINDMEGNLLLLNDAYARILGAASVEEVLQRNYRDFTPEGYKDEDIRQIAELERTGQFGPFEKEYLRLDKSVVRVRLMLQLIHVNGEKYMWATIQEIDDEGLF